MPLKNSNSEGESLSPDWSLSRANSSVHNASAAWKVDSSLVAHYQENLREWRRPQKYLPPDHAARGKSNNSEKNWNQGQNCLIHRRKRLYPCHSSLHIVFKVNGEDFSSPSAETSPPAGDFGFRHCRNILYHIMTLRCKWRARGSLPCDTVDVIRSVPFSKLPPLPRQAAGTATGRLVPAVNQLDVACPRQRQEPT